MKRLARRTAAFAALLAAAPALFAAVLVRPALEAPLSAPAVSAAPLSAASAAALPLLPAPLQPPVALSAPEPAAVAAEIRAAASALPSAAPLAAFAEKHGIATAVTPFAGKSALGLDPDHLAQYVNGDKRVYVNWDYVGGDLRALEAAGFSPVEARRVVGLLAAPVYAHELRHAELRHAYGADFPGLAEEEILTHLQQAQAMDEALRSRPDFAALKPLLEKLFLYDHSKRLVDLAEKGFGALAEHVLRRYRGISPTLDAPAKNAADARATLARLEADPAAAPPGWIAKARANLAFWESPAEIRKLTAFLQARIDAAYAALHD